jgi:formate dehydrogenase
MVAGASLADLAARCDVGVPLIAQVAREFAGARTAMCVANTGVSQTRHGTLGEWLSHVLNFVTDRVDRPGGRRYERGHVDVGSLWGRMARPSVTRSRVSGRPSVGGYRALADLPDEIRMPGRGRVRALITVAGNPVVSGPNGRALDDALASLDLLVAVDLVQRESHRHAQWLLPTAHWLERSDTHPFVAQIQDQPYAHPGARAIEPPPGVKEEWEIFTDVALAMGVPLFGVRGVNTLVRVTRGLARGLRCPSLAFNPRWLERAVVRLGRRVRWKDLQAHPHGWVYGERRYGDLTFCAYTARSGAPPAVDRPAPRGLDEFMAQRAPWATSARHGELGRDLAHGCRRTGREERRRGRRGVGNWLDSAARSRDRGAPSGGGRDRTRLGIRNLRSCQLSTGGAPRGQP